MEGSDAGIPTSVWERLLEDKRRLAAVAIAAVAAMGLLAWAVAIPLLSSDDAPDESAESADVPGPRDPSRSVPPTGGIVLTDTPSPGATDGAGASSQDATTSDSVPVRAALIAYRADGRLYVSKEDGTQPRQVAVVASGAFALSPDGGTLAYVDPATHRLHLTDVASGEDVPCQIAEDAHLVWSPTSDTLIYVAKSKEYEVRRVGRHGRDDALVGAGHTPAIDSAGRRVAYIRSVGPGQAGPIAVQDLSQPVRVMLDETGDATEVVFGGDGLIYAVPGSGTGQERIMTSRLDGSAARVLVGAMSDDKPVQYSSLCVSPGRSHLTYAASGDDGFSRAFVLALADPRPVSLTVRRDTYPMCWTADGTCLFFVEGNSFQGEPTSIMCARTDGTGRRVVVEGGGL